MIVNLKEHPEILRAIRAADPTYRKQKATIVVSPRVEIQGTYWDGGSRSTYSAVDLTTGRMVPSPQYNPPQFGGPSEAPTVELPEGVVMVRTGIFCGRTAAASVYVRPDNVAKALPGMKALPGVTA